MTEDKFQRSTTGLGDTWRAMKEVSKNDPELKNELDDIELAALKRKDYKFNKELKKWVNAEGDRLNAADAIRERKIVRLSARRFIKDEKKLNEFMTAKSFEEFKAGPYEKILHKLKDPDRVEKTKAYTPQKTDFVNPESNTAEKITPNPIKTTDDILFENFVESQKLQKIERDYELNNKGIATLKDFI